MVLKEIKDYVIGKYGKAPGPIAQELKDLILRKGVEPITCRPADLLEPGYAKAVEESKEFAKTKEDVLTYALFPQIGKEFLLKKYGR